MNPATTGADSSAGFLCRRFRAASRSLSLRLLGIFALATVLSLAILVVFFSKGLGSQWRNTIQPHVVQYLSYIQQDLGDPPDPLRAQALSDRLPVDIVIYKAGSLFFSSDQPAPAVRDLRYRRIPLSRIGRGSGAERPEGTVAISRDGGERNSVLRFERDGYTAYYRFGRGPSSSRASRDDPRNAGVLSGSSSTPGPTHKRSSRRDRFSHELAWALLAVAIVMGASYGLIRRLLSPIGRIRRGVGRMTRGDLGERVGLRGHDDLAVLGNSIDTMAERIEAMLDAKRQLLMALSHELRSPLARARLALELLPESSRRDTIEEELREMQTLITEIVESEQLQQAYAVLNRAPVDLAKLVQEESDGHEAVESIVETDLDPDEDVDVDGRFVLIADAARLRILVRNLVANALLHGRSSDGKAVVHVTLTATRHELILEVADAGPGIPPDDLSRITDPLYRPDASRSRSTGGFGLGLTLARSIAEAHDGSLQVDSEPAVRPGTRVRVALPRSASSPP